MNKSNDEVILDLEEAYLNMKKDLWVKTIDSMKFLSEEELIVINKASEQLLKKRSD